MISVIQDFLGQAKKPLLAIVGPTASGKTSISIEIAQKFSGEIINADSRQVFQEIDIVSAKITTREMAGIPHHLFSFVAPDQNFTVAEWKTLAETKAEEILARQKLPILCGGTGLYVNALTKNFAIPRIPPNTKFRTSLQNFSDAELWQKLQKTDPQSAQKFHQNNRKAVERALEICHFSKDVKQELKGEPHFESLILGIAVNRTKLYERINKRVFNMLEMGLLDEVRALLEKGYYRGQAGMLSHGIPEAIDYLEDKISKEEFIAKMQQITRNFAKRQLTWWRRDERVVWINPETMEIVKGAEINPI